MFNFLSQNVLGNSGTFCSTFGLYQSTCFKMVWKFFRRIAFSTEPKYHKEFPIRTFSSSKLPNYLQIAILTGLIISNFIKHSMFRDRKFSVAISHFHIVNYWTRPSSATYNVLSEVAHSSYGIVVK